MYEIIHHGGRHGVTGSCHELRLGDDFGLLVDCGLFQGEEERSPAIEFPVAHLRGMVLTHVHLDHCGRIPYLLAAGFRGPIFCSEPSATLLPLMLEDALRVGVTRDSRLIASILRRLKRQLVPLPYGRWRNLPGPGGTPALRIKLQPAGHILGSAYVLVRISPTTPPPASADRSLAGAGEPFTLLFSGDLGAPYAPLLPAPRPAYGCDLLLLESTYGDRDHAGRRERRRQLEALLLKALVDRGTVLVPAFALGRTQELLYELEEILRRNRGRLAARGLPWEDLEVVIDSPLASRLTGAYRSLAKYWDAEARRRVAAGRHPLDFAQLTTVGGHEEHLALVRRLARSGGPAIVVAAGGMCSGGRIVNYLKALVGDRRTDVLLVGYQAAGTPGRQLQIYGPRGGYVILDGQRFPIRARIHTLTGYSAHAGRSDLLRFVTRMRMRPEKIRLIHGEPEARAALAGDLRRALPETEVEE